MTDNTIGFETSDGAALITLKRPDVLNSFNREMAAELVAALESVRDTDSIRAALITGEGRAFCAGQDLDAVIAKDGNPAPELGDIVRDCYNPIVRLIRTIEKPIVAAVNGVAAGAGANLALCCDVVLASEKASFIQSFVNVGLIPDTAGTFFLPRLVGLQRASAMMILGDKIAAAKALEFGMIYKVCAPEELQSEALAMTKHLATQPTKGIGLTKRLLNASVFNSLDEQLKQEEQLQTLAGHSKDYNEGVSAFLEKRKPNFTGN
ncbi:MAG: 2-(1,2-epoxy-1,2-dihydrophenyl)acetyl-CoA isomerase [Bdellovibrionales bacterium]|nr:2-(1,2-epoxy-1,2-dihydrophenyl)acetyl-CoA isomerase [Bdellovibrionales bacterium]